jgi:glycosyltransferase involved in cell wall biosynthesis
MDTMTLSIIIPAYNEEDAIAAIIERCLAVRDRLIEHTSVGAVEIIVVNDGSRDHTLAIARQYPEVTTISFEKNRGYGAAIKCGFAKASGELVAFLDADGTCDPRYFIDMCNALVNEHADIVIGSRMAPENKMPKVRRIGNSFFAALINVLGTANITDSASGMRVIKKSSLEKIYPLPDGLHFTPAMSCRAVLDGDIKIIEVPMKYEERVGQSKLGVVKDGMRFLKTILDIALTYEPFRFFGTAGTLFFACGFLWGLYPVWYYASFRVVPDYMIYRLMTVTVLIVIGFMMFTVGIISDEVTGLLQSRSRVMSNMKKSIYRMLSQRKLIVSGIACAAIGILINYRTIKDYLSTGLIYVHWVYVVTGAFLVMLGLQVALLGVLRRILSLLYKVRSERAEHNQRYLSNTD